MFPRCHVGRIFHLAMRPTRITLQWQIIRQHSRASNITQQQASVATLAEVETETSVASSSSSSSAARPAANVPHSVSKNARRAAQLLSLAAAHRNSPNDPHLQVVLDLAYGATRLSHIPAYSLAAQLLNCVGLNRQAERPAKLWATHWPGSTLGVARWTNEHDHTFMKPTINNNNNDKQEQDKSTTAATTDASSLPSSSFSSSPLPPVSPSAYFQTPLHLYKNGLPKQRLVPRTFGAAKFLTPIPTTQTTSSIDESPSSPPVSHSADATSSSSSSSSSPLACDPFVAALMLGDARFNNPVTPARDLQTRVWDLCVDERPVEDIFLADRVVYLCPESPHILDHISTDNVYVIGGLVDRSVVKGVSLARAQAAGFRTARLPIKETLGDVSFSSHKASSLNIDTVFHLLLDWSNMKRSMEKQRERMSESWTVEQERVEREDMWRRVLTKHIPARYWILAGQSQPMSKEDADMAATWAALGVAPTRSAEQICAALSLQSHMRKQEYKFALQRQRPKFIPQHILDERAAALQAKSTSGSSS